MSYLSANPYLMTHLTFHKMTKMRFALSKCSWIIFMWLSLYAPFVPWWGKLHVSSSLCVCHFVIINSLFEVMAKSRNSKKWSANKRMRISKSKTRYTLKLQVAFPARNIMNNGLDCFRRKTLLFQNEWELRFRFWLAIAVLMR